MASFASTFFSTSTKALLRRLVELPHHKSPSLHTVLFSLAPSPTISQPELQELVSHLTVYPSSIGCLSAPIRVRSRVDHLRNATKGNLSEWRDITVCSVATFDSALAVPFWSEIPGKEATQVGRWHAFRKREDSAPDSTQAAMHEEGREMDWENVWAQKSSSLALPDGLDALSPSDVKSIVYMSDNAPEGLIQSLEYFDDAAKLGLVASSTPFVTGRPHTLFYNTDVRSSGAVGLAFRTKPNFSVRFPELQPITEILEVTSTEGNLVNSLDHKNPSRIILSAIEEQNGTNTSPDARIKDDEFFLGVHRGDELYQLYNIMSGDPSRGTIALQSDAAPQLGSTVKIYRSSPQASIQSPLHEGLSFVTTPQSGHVELAEEVDEDGVLVYQGAFLATSENGFVVQRVNEGAWKSTVQGGRANLSWGT